MKVTILHLTDPHWICFNAKDSILSKIYHHATGNEQAKAQVVDRVRQLIEKEVADYDHISYAFNQVDLTHHFKKTDGTPNTSVLVNTGDLANFFDYHRHLNVGKQFADIKDRFLPLIEDKHPFDVKIAVPGNHDVDKDSQSRHEAVRFRKFYAIFDKSWKTSLTDPSFCIGDKPNQVRIWLLNSSRRVGIDEQHNDGQTSSLDTVHIFEQDIKHWRETLHAEDRMRLVVMHHSPVPNDSDLRKRDVFLNNHEFNGALIRTNVKLVLSGHHHIGDELFAAIPGCVQPIAGRNEAVAANPMIESGFLSVSAPTFLRSPARAGFSQGFNIVEVEILPTDNMATVTVTKYRFTSERNDPRFAVMECPLRYRIALARLQDIFPDRVARERRIAVLENAAREIYSTRPIEPLERVLGIKLSDKTIEDLHRLIDSLKRRKERILGLYSLTVLPPAAWWANQLTRRFRVAFLENINRAIHRGASPDRRRPTALFQLSDSLHSAVTQALSGAETLSVAQRLRSSMPADDLFTHEERDWITENLEAAGSNSEAASLSAWGRNASVTPYDDSIAEGVGDGNVIHTILKKAPWDIPLEGEPNDIRRLEDSFELARIVYWPIEDFDTGYALRVIEFHEDFHVPLFWLSPEWLLGRSNQPRKSIGSFLICERGLVSEKAKTYWSNIRGEAPTERDLYQTGQPAERGKALQFWGTDAYPNILRNSPNSGALEMRALLRRPDILFASDVWALRKMGQTDLVTDYLSRKREECIDWLEG